MILTKKAHKKIIAAVPHHLSLGKTLLNRRKNLISGPAHEKSWACAHSTLGQRYIWKIAVE